MARRTLLFINSRFLPFVGGGQTYIFELMEYFSAQGWDVHLATRNCGVVISEWKGCTIHYIEGFDDEGQQPRKSLHDMRKVLDRVRPDLVHVHNVWPFFTYSNVVQPGEFPAVLTIHNVPVIPERLFGNGSLGDYGVECAFFGQLLLAGKHDRLLVGSQYYLDAFSEALPQVRDGGISEVAYYFLPRTTKGPMVPKAGSFTGEVRVLFPSRVLPRKGIEDMLAALAELPERFILEVPAFVNGDHEDYRQKLRSLIRALGIEGRVRLASRPTALEEMPEYYKRADIAVVPSHFEGFGIVALEAMSWGLPLVAADVHGLREIVRHERNGLLVPVQNPTRIAEAILRLVADSDLRSALTRAGVVTAQTEFTFGQQMAQMEAVYADALRTHGR